MTSVPERYRGIEHLAVFRREQGDNFWEYYMLKSMAKRSIATKITARTQTTNNLVNDAKRPEYLIGAFYFVSEEFRKKVENVVEQMNQNARVIPKDALTIEHIIEMG